MAAACSHAARVRVAAPRSRGAARASTSARAVAAGVVLARAAEEDIDVDDEKRASEDPEGKISSAMAAFADAGFPSDEDDAMDPISRTKAMNGAVDDLNSLMDSEVEVLGEAFDLLEKLGVKGLAKPPRRGEDADEEEEEEKEVEEK
jgi:hypothetical protein